MYQYTFGETKNWYTVSEEGSVIAKFIYPEDAQRYLETKAEDAFEEENSND